MSAAHGQRDIGNCHICSLKIWKEKTVRKYIPQVHLWCFNVHEIGAEKNQGQSWLSYRIVPASELQDISITTGVETVFLEIPMSLRLEHLP